ncbi:ephrin-B2 [Elysia marginata]|uniref:Ephrin-B2 n=1 Tax=Elysia marginata TaxID=1093978 RepID=A0AAV4EFQ2_9GAST|nr:ephrin-B2 [Elysia marginata]
MCTPPPLSVYRFQTNDSYLEFWEGDSISFICPYYPDADPRVEDMEYYIIYMVSKRMYDECIINDKNAVEEMSRCTTPTSRTRNAHLLMSFSPQGLDFRKDEDYYFICK